MLRQWQILMALNSSRRGLTVKELSEVLEDGSIRTVFRDIQHLQQAGFQLTSDDGRWQLVGARPDTVRVSPADVAALETLERALPTQGGGWALEHVRALRIQLAAELTPEGRAFAEELAGLSAVTLPGANQAGLPCDDEVMEAIAKQHVLRIRYRAPDKVDQGDTVRDVEPYAVWMAKLRPYLIAHCRTAGDLRTFHRARIREAEVLDEPFDPDPGFDLEAFVAERFGVHSGAPMKVQLELAPEIVHVANERRLHPSQRVEQRDGVAVLTFTAAGTNEVAAWVASFGGLMRVVAPPELRDAVRRIHEEGMRACGVLPKVRLWR